MKNKKEEVTTSLYTLASKTYNSRLKQIKKSLGSQCTFMSNYIDSEGARFVKAVVNKEEFLFEIPYDLTKIKLSDYNYLKELIESKKI